MPLFRANFITKAAGVSDTVNLTEIQGIKRVEPSVTTKHGRGRMFSRAPQWLVCNWHTFAYNSPLVSLRFKTHAFCTFVVLGRRSCVQIADGSVYDAE